MKLESALVNGRVFRTVVEMDHLVSLAHFLILLALLAALGTAVANLACFHGLREARPDADAPLVSILIPARNEERSISECVRSLLAQDYPFCEVIVLDDDSTDGTAEILRGQGLRERGVVSRLMQGRPLPPGWTGKAWACHQLAQEARGAYLFFTDADTVHDRRTVSALLAYARRHDADLVSAWPRLITVTWSEKLIIPLIILLAMTLYPHWLILLLQRFPWVARRLPGSWLRWLGAANGQSMFFRRAAYDRIGGHASVRDHLVEDVALGRAITERMGEGLRLFNCEAIQFSKCRMYRAPGEVWEGFTKNLWPAFEGSFVGFFSVGAAQFSCFLLPCLLLVSRGGHRSAILEEVLLICTIRLLLTLRFRTSWLSLALHPVGHALALAIGLNSWRGAMAGRVIWKGREYSGSQTLKLK